MDHPADVPRRIVESQYDHDSRANTLSLDAGSDKLTAILERLGIGLIDVIGSG
jgi:hypothetical protein